MFKYVLQTKIISRPVKVLFPPGVTRLKHLIEMQSRDRVEEWFFINGPPQKSSMTVNKMAKSCLGVGRR